MVEPHIYLSGSLHYYEWAEFNKDERCNDLKIENKQCLIFLSFILVGASELFFADAVNDQTRVGPKW